MPKVVDLDPTTDPRFAAVVAALAKQLPPGAPRDSEGRLEASS